MIEKEELVQALCNALEERYNASKNFSRSGKIVPGLVADVDESVLLQELGWLESDVNRGVIPTTQVSSTSMQEQETAPHAPILLDVYATWCGPCKFLAPILESVAEEVGPTVRVMKLDSDKYPRLSSVLKGECVS
jgi:thiol-disulfide isomerase/thioredoxin